MKSAEPHGDYWFPAKRFGWGWGPPRRWEGWAVLGGYLASLLLLSLLLTRGDNELLFGISVAILTVVLFVICWLKGEPPRWRWGGDDDRLP